MAGLEPYITDADAGFLKVDTQLPPHQLPAGVAADAVNKRSEKGEAWPRNGITSEQWGQIDFVGLSIFGNPPSVATKWAHSQYPLVIGRRYLYVKGNEDFATDALTFSVNPPTRSPSGNNIAAGYFIAQTTQINFWWHNSLAANLRCTAHVYGGGRPRGFSRFIDPDGFDNLVVVTDDWRIGTGEDGGIGRAWRMISGNLPQEIPLNGQDVYGETRLVPCFNGLLLLRQDQERHYFQAAAVNAGTNQIQLNATPSWADGDIVYFFAFPNSYILGTSPPNPQTTYRVKNIAGNLVELYRDGALTQQLDFTGGALGSFYLERRAVLPGPFGNGAPPLLMQTDGTGATVWQIGFKAVPPYIAATAFDGTAKVLTAANHRLIPGDKIVYTHTTAATENFFVMPVSNDAVMLYTTVDLALAGGLTNAQTPSPAFTAGDFITKGGAGGLPMPPLREGAYLTVNRLVGFNGRTSMPISDPMDPLHFTPVADTVTASLGEGDQANGILEMSKDRFIIAKNNVLLQFFNISQASSAWQLTKLTGEFGWIAPLAMVAVGKDGWGLANKKGITSVFQTEQGEIQGLADPVSRPMQKYIDLIDWVHASQACAATWNNRVFFAVPLKGQVAGSVVNNAVLVYNILNAGWEGIWTGAMLQVYAFARNTVYGEERLCWVNYQSQVAFFNDGFTDNGAPISDLLVTRMYQGTDVRLQGKPKIWLIANVIWETLGPSLKVDAIAPGFNESFNLVTGLTYDKTKYLVNGKADYNPAAPANFSDPYRQDYSSSITELMAGPIDAHQNVGETFRMRVNDWGVQLSIANSSGSARILSVTVKGMPTLQVASRSA